MNTKSKTAELVNRIQKEATQFLNYVKALNECAYTDSMCENIIKLALELAKVNDQEFLIKSPNPLKEFIHEEVPFRYKELIDEDFGLTEEEMRKIADDVYDNDTDVFFDYDAIDNLLIEKAEEYVKGRETQ